MKICLRCVAIYALSLPPIFGFMVIKKIMFKEGFKESIDDLREQIEALVASGKAAEEALKNRSNQ